MALFPFIFLLLNKASKNLKNSLDQIFPTLAENIRTLPDF